VTRDPTVTIITPAYNASEFVAETIASALAQTWRDFELLIVDDGSTDTTLSIAQAWERTDRRIRVLTRVHGGPAAARNTAIAHARGAFLALLDSDDVWFPSFLEAQMAVFREFRPCDVVTGNAYNRGGPRDGQPLKRVGPKRPLSLLQILESESSVCIMSVFRRTVAERIGGFNEALPVTGLVLTKMDGTAKGGAVVAIESELKVPTKLMRSTRGHLTDAASSSASAGPSTAVAIDWRA